MCFGPHYRETSYFANLKLCKLLILEECVILWGEYEWIRIEYTEQWHAHDCYQIVTKTSDHRIWHKRYKHKHNTRIVSQAIVQWSSTAHGVYGVLHTGSTCTLQDKRTWCSLHWNGVDRWSTFTILFDMHQPPSLSNFKTGNNTSNDAIEMVGCSWSMSSIQLVCDSFLANSLRPIAPISVMRLSASCCNFQQCPLERVSASVERAG